jgi:hypothetical protein
MAQPLDRTGNRSMEGALASADEQRANPRVPVCASAMVDQPSLWPEPFDVVMENVSLGGAYFASRYLFSPYDFFHCRLVLPGIGSVAGNELRLSAVVVRVEDQHWTGDGHCGVGAFFVALDQREEEVLQGFIREQGIDRILPI